MRTRAFTLIELLIVVAIIGILATVSLANLSNARSKARDSKRIANIKQTSTALALYYDSNNQYPAGTASRYIELDGTAWRDFGFSIGINDMDYTENIVGKRYARGDVSVLNFPGRASAYQLFTGLETASGNGESIRTSGWGDMDNTTNSDQCGYYEDKYGSYNNCFVIQVK
ncbi:MAG: type II secretion system protein [Patescibacteria group bacterium]|jgi:prepilin-type N-terminal cleavage/methylation domain-containing protein